MLKQALLAELEACPGQPLSGQELADRHRVSRSAVWKAMRGLMAEGYPIVAVGRKGYQLDKAADLLTESAVRACLAPAHKELPIAVFSAVDSTNLAAQRAYVGGQTGDALFLAEMQLHGRAHKQKSFYSPAKTGLYMSLLLRRELAVADTALVTYQAGVAVVDAVQALLQRRLTLMGVNDIYLGSQKVGGILSEALATDLESQLVRAVCIGIGINLTTTDFPIGLRGAVTAIGAVPRAALAAAITDRLLDADYTDRGAILDAYRRCHAAP